MTAVQLMMAVGQSVLLRHGSLRIDCKVLDAKQSYGITRVLIAPTAGSGQAWVDLSSLSLPSTAAHYYRPAVFDNCDLEVL